MTPEERAWCESVHQQAMRFYGLCGLIEVDEVPGSKTARRARKAALEALALASEALARIRDAQMSADQAAPDRFDLGALSVDLAAAAPEMREE